MYKMMIVDDEPLVRLALHQMIPWQELNIQIVCEAGDGLEALSILQQRDDIDLLFMDIKMPKMSGIELLRTFQTQAASTMPITIILSAFNEYEYVREAFVLGAFDFIIKTDMDDEHIQPIVMKALCELKKRGIQGAKASEKVSDKRENKEQALRQFLTMDANKEEAEYARLAEQMRSWLGETNQIAAVLSLSRELNSPGRGGHKNGTKTESFIIQTMETVFNSMFILHEVLCQDAQNYILLCSLPQYRSTMAIREQLQAAFSLIKIRLEQFFNVRIAVGISDAASGVHSWHRLYQQAYVLEAISYYEGSDQLLFSELLSVEAYKKDGKSNLMPEIRKSAKAISSEVIRLLEHEDPLRWREKYNELVSCLWETKGQDPQDTKVILSDFLWELGAPLYQKGIRWEDLHYFDGEHIAFSDPFEWIKSSPTLSAAVTGLSEICQCIFELLHQRHLQSYAHSVSPVMKAKTFIDGHFQEDLHLTLISKMVGVSEGYLSKQFVKETGSSFIQYMTNLRIEESKRLMKTGLRISDISEKIGYVNPEHFSRMFKKVTGLSPKAYRDGK
ncbi:response regulator [Paenibacillus alba]|uniref:response regulator transcription factor n=1 Tax=Paenibacillus alba TaxID=1197127 RepID=UPI00156351E6|nr:response regulator [Paenibacillus alba]NQX71128.1 response regulator [Paenibacillus alba]